MLRLVWLLLSGRMSVEIRPQPKVLRPITMVPCRCMNCTWFGLTGMCESDDDGQLTCPDCSSDVFVDYLPHELAP